MLKMANLFIDSVQLIVDGELREILKIGSGGAYNPNRVRENAVERGKSKFPSSKLVAIILHHRRVTLEEYQEEFGDTPSWIK